MARVVLNGNQGMRHHKRSFSSFTNDDDDVQSGSATGFSDGEGEDMAQVRVTKKMHNAFDPVTQILDKIDAELVSLTRSNGNSSATTSEITTIRRPSSQPSAQFSKIENGEGLTISELGTTFKPSVSLQSLSSRNASSSDRDTGIGTGASSYLENSLQHRAIAVDIRPLEPGDQFKGSKDNGHHQRSNTAPETMYLNGHHIVGQSDDDKSRRENLTTFSLEAKQVDDKFKEIMQKRKGGFLSRASGDEGDDQTIRTEDFCDKFHDTMVYSSDEAERLRNLDDDLQSDGGWDTDTLQQKLAMLTCTPIPTITMTKATGPGTPPVYPKPNSTSTLPRPSVHSSLKFLPGHTTDRDSTKPEDIENSFRGMVAANGERAKHIDLHTSSLDPIHTKVKQLLKATAKYKPKLEYKNKQHVRISPKPPQYQSQDKGDDSDDTLCSDKEGAVFSPRDDAKVPDSTEADARKEIACQSDRIRQEMERERRTKSQSPIRDRSPTRTYISLTSGPLKAVYDKRDRHHIIGGGEEKDKLNINDWDETKDNPNISGGSEKCLSDEDKERTAELKATQNTLDVTQSALYEAQKSLKDVQAQYEGVRSQLMLTEYKKEKTSKELGRLGEDLRRKQSELDCIDTQVKSQREEIEHFDAIGLTKDEATQLIEANEQMKNRLRNVDTVHAERDELIQQLELAKQELFTEQKRARTKIEELKEELENMTSTYEQMQTEHDDTLKKLQKIESAFKKMEKEKNEIIQEKTMQYEEERDKNKTEKTEWRKRNLDEVEMMRQDLIRMTNMVAGLQDEIRSKDELNLQLRDQLLETQQKTQEERVNNSSILEDHKRILQTLRKETDSAMVQLRESLFLEKQKTIDAMHKELDQERQDITARSEERFQAQIADQTSIIKTKNAEIAELAKIIKTLETDQTINKVRMDDEIKMQVQEAVNRERSNMVNERDWAIVQERETLQREHRQQIKHLKEELTCMSQEQKSLETKMKEQRNELEDLKNSNKTVVHEKLIAVARAKELMRQEQQAEIERITEQMRNEHKIEIDKLRDTIRIQEDELCKLREEKLKYLRQHKENNHTLDRTERTVISEINEECRKTSEVLGLSPRKVNINSYRDTTVSSPAHKNSASTKSATTAALANLRACNEELRMHVTDLKRELEAQHDFINIAEIQKNEALNNLKRQLEKEKEEEMVRLKEKLVKGLSTNDYRSVVFAPDNDMSIHHRYDVKTYPNERSLKQMSYQQEQDLDRLEKEINKLAMFNGPETNDQRDVDYVKRLAQLQAKVKQLQASNSNFHRAKLTAASSSPDLTSSDRKYYMRSPSPTRDQLRLASTLEFKLREHDYETEMLTDHQRQNRDIMSRKMAEMSKLQNTLTNQAKELIQLEKAYTQLNQYAKSPSQVRSTVR